MFPLFPFSFFSFYQKYKRFLFAISIWVAHSFFLFSWAHEKGLLDVREGPPFETLKISHLDSTLRSAHRAQASGFSSLAIAFFREALSDEKLTGKKRNDAILGLASALLSNGKHKEAAKTLNQFSGKPTDPLFLRRAWIAYQKKEERGKNREKEEVINNDKEKILQSIARIKPSALPPSEKGWLFLLLGLLAEEGLIKEQASPLFEKAYAATMSKRQQFLFEGARYRARLLSDTENLDSIGLTKLKAKFVQEKDPLLRFQYGKLYAIALYQRKNNEQAVEVINKTLATTPAKDREMQGQLLFLLGMISGVDTGTGKKAFEEMLRLNGSREEQWLALQLLADNAFQKNKEEDLETFLNTLINDKQPHVLLDVFYYLLAEIQLRKEFPQKAERMLKEQLLEKFPNSSLKKNVYYLLARIAWEKDPPQYRIIADCFSQLRLEENKDKEKATLAILVADCFYLNGDYENAADAYGIAMQEMTDAGQTKALGTLFFQRIQSLLEMDRLADAQTIIDEKEADVAPVYRWRAEWNLATKMRAAGKTNELIKRLSRILKESQFNRIPVALQLRFMWLDAQISMEVSGEYVDIPAKTNRLLDLLEQSKGLIPSSTYAELKTYTLLLKGRAYLINAQSEEQAERAFSVFKQLREAFPAAEPTVLSYLIQARYLAGNDRIVDAQKELRMLADKFPNSRYAPIALYEAAIFAEQRGSDATEEGPAKILEKLAVDYAKDGLVFYARLRRADIARLNNNFRDALILYDDLLKQYPNHPEVYRAGISRADCLFAQAGQNEDRLSEAVAAYERLFEQTNLPADLRAEAGFKWAYAVTRKGDVLRSQMIYARILDVFLKTPSDGTRDLHATGPFWLSRSLFELGTLLEQEAKWEEARNAYRKILAYGLPGSALAKDKINPSKDR